MSSRKSSKRAASSRKRSAKKTTRKRSAKKTTRKRPASTKEKPSPARRRILRPETRSEVVRQGADARVEELMEKGRTYDEIVAALKTEGFDLSRSSIGRYGKRFFDALVELHQNTAEAKELIEFSKREGSILTLEEANSALLLSKFMSKILEIDKIDEEAISLTHALAKLQSSAASRARVQLQSERVLRVVFERVRTLIKLELSKHPKVLDQVFAVVDQVEQEAMTDPMRVLEAAR